MLAALLSTTLATAAARGQAVPAPVVQPGESADDARLKQLFYNSDESSLKRHPIEAVFRGDLRYADRFGDYLTDAYLAAERAAVEHDLATLNTIDRTKLTPTDQIAYDVFKTRNETDLAGFAPALLKVQRDLPIDHMNGFQTFYPDFASGNGAAPFKTLADYENNLKRNAKYAVVLDRAIGLFRQGMKDKIVQPKLVVTNMIQEFDNLIAEGVEGSTFYGPVKTFPATIPAADQARLKAAYGAQIRDVIIPAHRQMRDFLVNVYLPAARDTVGLSSLPGGDAYYTFLIRQNTTLPMTAEQVHQLGLTEVARILKGMEAQKQAVGFKGDLPTFFAFLRTDKQFQPSSVDQLRDGYRAIEARISKLIPEQFSLTPKTTLDIRPVPAFKEKTEAAGSYNGGTPDGSRPGVFYYNTYDLPSRYTWEMETLFLHEGVPGHHFQISLAQENTALPAFMRFGGNTAYVEGWALYAESLWKELGMETDPYERMGGLNDEMLRAMRLVVDSGIHAKGWTRDQAIDYMLANSPMARTDATAEVERYIAIPGQALAYKIGQLTITGTKAKARAMLGPKFDPRDFHAQVLDTGALPMPVLEAKIDKWIAAGGGAAKRAAAR
ncbi:MULTISPECIES: DUF885 domain-containing protein [unclassified Sphingomonas]|uniref:DUF885 domain-containing protein n=1 Tax=unclassified Sphingomonas TaxID=196159 RepID=UPI0006FF5114|nr:MULTISPECIES: DUF885 domain-containing protein [unclassified Sphingomonas]KQN13289.1 hypothetical protein ASE89_13950 [Sphingomonas sp. Leaf30]MBD8552192.1 DUF885 domain-containing protein [Sphingomonas sp. CFBP 8764]